MYTEQIERRISNYVLEVGLTCSKFTSDCSSPRAHRFDISPQSHFAATYHRGISFTFTLVTSQSRKK